MRRTHEQNPLHRVAKWVGSHFENSHLWEVGCYVLVPHQGNMICDNLRAYVKELERDEESKDSLEKVLLATSPAANDKMPANPVGREESAPFERSGSVDDPLDKVNIQREMEENLMIDSYIEEIYGRSGEDIFEPTDDEPDDHNSWVPASLPQYLSSDHLTGEVDSGRSSGHQRQNSNSENLEANEDSGFDGQVPFPRVQFPGDFPNVSQIMYVRIVHTSGIHHIGMVSCSCQGGDLLPMDLMAANLIPSSFKKIRTLFTAGLLDQYRLCNLEMKATAHQFYHYLRRITSSLDPASVVNVIHEFRRLTRLWRWMKKLKWAGYGHNGKDPLKADNGELANFCVACPQQGKNIPDNWREHANAWMYRLQLAADGNFKADHVKSHQPNKDVWLMDGGGISPNSIQYKNFLSTAAEIPTVSIH